VNGDREQARRIKSEMRSSEQLANLLQHYTDQLGKYETLEELTAEEYAMLEDIQRTLTLLAVGKRGAR
jgi:hypothetical protein